ncbi:hypothetical protein B296_00036020 [Ensete ventricosum]|uniref:Homeobox domain-containing protein n=1 Tax=Ensete ventricosum TaxID=4639 RepID=A0A426YDB2_ENSVE|nr:hypothetical protein B296_00036020 [Ensete ventricosum]
MRYREELTRPLEEATDFLKTVESQFNALTNTSSSRLFSSGNQSYSLSQRPLCIIIIYRHLISSTVHPSVDIVFPPLAGGERGERRTVVICCFRCLQDFTLQHRSANGYGSATTAREDVLRGTGLPHFTLTKTEASSHRSHSDGIKICPTASMGYNRLRYDEKCEDVASSEEDPDASGGEADILEIDPRAEDQELKHHLLKKYSGYLSSLRQELSKKRKKGKLPKEARQKLLKWWELHYKWPYPSGKKAVITHLCDQKQESEKLALAESTGLDQKQINNWFINQRKRHWRPSEDMQLMVMDGFHPQNAAALYMEGHFTGDGLYRVGP